MGAHVSWFLVLDLPACEWSASLFCRHAFSAVLDCPLNLWSKINAFFLKMFFEVFGHSSEKGRRYTPFLDKKKSYLWSCVYC